MSEEGSCVVEQYNITLRDGFGGAKNRPKRKHQPTDNAWYYLGLAGQIGYVIALPIAGGAILGSLSGHKLLGIGIGVVISVIGFVRIIQKLMAVQK